MGAARTWSSPATAHAMPTVNAWGDGTFRWLGRGEQCILMLSVSHQPPIQDTTRPTASCDGAQHAGKAARAPGAAAAASAPFNMGTMLSSTLGCLVVHAAFGRMGRQQCGFAGFVIAVSWRPRNRRSCHQTLCLLHLMMCHAVHTASGSTSRAGTRCNCFVLCRLGADKPSAALLCM